MVEALVEALVAASPDLASFYVLLYALMHVLIFLQVLLLCVHEYTLVDVYLYVRSLVPWRLSGGTAVCSFL